MNKSATSLKSGVNSSRSMGQMNPNAPESQQMQAQTVPNMGMGSQFGAAPTPLMPVASGVQIPCGRCKKVVMPCNDKYPSMATHLVALCLFLCGLPFCIFFPYCCDCFGKPVKRCPNCGNFFQGGPLMQ